MDIDELHDFVIDAGLEVDGYAWQTMAAQHKESSLGSSDDVLELHEACPQQLDPANIPRAVSRTMLCPATAAVSRAVVRSWPVCSLTTALSAFAVPQLCRAHFFLPRQYTVRHARGRKVATGGDGREPRDLNWPCCPKGAGPARRLRRGAGP
jgi:hypothetical protein